MVKTIYSDIEQPAEAGEAVSVFSEALDDFDARQNAIHLDANDANLDLSATDGDGHMIGLRAKLIRMTGTLTAARTVTFPDRDGQWIFWNDTTGGYAVTLQSESPGTTISVPAGRLIKVYLAENASVYDVLSSAPTLLESLHIQSAASGATTPNTSADEFIIEGAGAIGQTFMMEADGRGSLYWSTPAGNAKARIEYYGPSHATYPDEIHLHIGTALPIRLQAAQALFLDGTVSLPGMAFAADPDTGIYRPTTNELAGAVGGAQAFRFDASKKFYPADDAVFASGKGIDFSAAGGNVLSDHAFGLHVATVTCATSGSYTLGAARLGYTKNGRVAHVQGEINVTGESSPSGQLRVSLPFTAGTLTDDSDRSKTACFLTNHGGTIVTAFAAVYPGEAYARLYAMSDAGVVTAIDETSVDGAFQIAFSLIYITA